MEMNDCRTTKAALADLLLDGAPAAPPVQAHLEGCPQCRAELESLHGTMALLDEWQAPEPSAYFTARMAARLREEQQRPSQGLLARVQSWFLLTNVHLKPVAGGAALALALIVGGGTYYETSQNTAPLPQASATVRDLQSLDENAQVFQQLNNLDQPDSADDGGGNSSDL